MAQSSKNKKDNPPDQQFLAELFSKHPAYFDSIIANKDLGIQVIYTKIDRKKSGKPVFTEHYYNVDSSKYFYPASTVKLPVAILALQKLRELNIPGLDMNTTMITLEDGDEQTTVTNDPSAADGRPTIAHYIKKIFLVSDNDAFNRLYEFLGQEYINTSLQKAGFTDIEILHRLSISLTEQQNRHSNPIRFLDSNGKIVYEKPAERSGWQYSSRSIRLGKGYIRGNDLVQEPFDFSQKNLMSLPTLHRILRTVLFPNSVPASQRFNLAAPDYEFLYRYMSMLPGESVSPSYGELPYWDNHILLSAGDSAHNSVRTFNKTGTAYGFLTDAAYIIDTRNGIEFMVSAVIYCNSDGVFNDDKYDYRTVGYPFLRHLGEVLYNYELSRERKRKPDFVALQFDYRK